MNGCAPLWKGSVAVDKDEAQHNTPLDKDEAQHITPQILVAVVAGLIAEQHPTMIDDPILLRVALRRYFTAD